MFCASSSLSTLQSHKKPGYCTPPIQKLLLKNHLHVVCKPCSTTERTEKLINHIPPIFIVVHRFYCWNCNQWRNAPEILGRYFYLTTFLLQVLVLVSNTEYSHVFVDLILSCSEANKQSYYTRRLSEQSIMSLCLLKCRLPCLIILPRNAVVKLHPHVEADLDSVSEKAWFSQVGWFYVFL